MVKSINPNRQCDNTTIPVAAMVSVLSLIIIVRRLQFQYIHRFYFISSFCCAGLARSKHSVHLDARKKDRRKVRASSLESSAESESSAMETGDGNSGQVAAVSSTASFKSPAVGIGEEETNGEKQVNTTSIAFITYYIHHSIEFHSKLKKNVFRCYFQVHFQKKIILQFNNERTSERMKKN